MMTFFALPRKAVGGEKGVEIDAEHRSHMLYSPLAVGHEQVAQVGLNALLVVTPGVANHVISKMPIRAIGVVGDHGEGNPPLQVNKTVLMCHLQDMGVQDMRPNEIPHLPRKRRLVVKRVWRLMQSTVPTCHTRPWRWAMSRLLKWVPTPFL